MKINFLTEGLAIETNKTFSNDAFYYIKCVKIKKPKKSAFSEKDMIRVGNQKTLDSSLSLCLTNGKPGFYFITNDVFVFSCSKMTPDGPRTAHADNWIILIPLTDEAKFELEKVIGYALRFFEFSVGKSVREFPSGEKDANLANNCIQRLFKSSNSLENIAKTFKTLMEFYESKGFFSK